MSGRPFVVRVSRAKAVVPVIACTGLIAFGLWSHMRSAETDLLRLIAVAAMAYLLLGSLLRLFAGVVLQIDAEGVLVPSHSATPIPWSQIVDARVSGTRHPVVAFTLADPARFPPDAPMRWASPASLNRLFARDEVVASMWVADRDAHAVIDIVSAIRPGLVRD